MQNNSQAVPYQAYKSKRHSRSVSAVPISANVPPPSVALTERRPLSADWDSEKLVLDIVPPVRDDPADSSPDTSPLPENPISHVLPSVNGKHKQQPDLATPSIPELSTISPSSPPTAPRKLSTFRRLQPPRQSTTRAPLLSSPLRPPESQSRTPSSSSTITRQLDFSPPPPRSPPLHTRVPSINSVIGDSSRPSPSHTPSSSTAPQPSSSAPQQTPSFTPSPISSASPPPSTSSLPPSHVRSSAPYRPGFQPRGVYRHRTDEFTHARKAKQDATRIERTKLERRLEKLINLHFPIQTSDPVVPKNNVADRRRSSIFDLDLESLRSMDATDIWKGVVQSHALQGPKADTRVAEQRIAPWQQDAAVSKCPMCNASFHPLTNRKHHCRLCGKIICSLPIKRLQRPEPCSVLFIVDSKTRQIEYVGEGVDYGVKRRASAAAMSKGNGKEKEKNETLPDDEKFLKGVRICRDCKPILSREQFYQQVSRIPPLFRLYEAFVNLEQEIEEALPLFQELLLTLNSDSPPSKEASAARKRILDDFASYDAIAKRIRKIPCTPGSSQDRVQLAIRTRADFFLQKNMFPLQSLPKVKKQTSSPDVPMPLVDPDSELAHALQPLLEQEALLESFVGEAMAHRKFEDAKTLKANLKEIRVEIDRMMENRAGSGST